MRLQGNLVANDVGLHGDDRVRLRMGVGVVWSPFFLAVAFNIILSRTFSILEAVAAALLHRSGDDGDESMRRVRSLEGLSKQKQVSSRIGDDTWL